MPFFRKKRGIALFYIFHDALCLFFTFLRFSYFKYCVKKVYKINLFL